MCTNAELVIRLFVEDSLFGGVITLFDEVMQCH